MRATQGNEPAGPIFIGGPDRCGKTTMRAFLVSHPRISIPAVGSNMWTYFYRQYGDLARPANFERCLEAMLHYKHVRFLKPDPERICREFQQGPPTYARLFALFQQHHAEREGKPRWGDQTGLIERYADKVFAAYPGARMIHMLRDPRDRYEASLALWPDGKGRAGGAAARWLYSAELAGRNQQRYPDRYLIVHFEALIRRPEPILRQICHLLGEEYVPDMLVMAGAPDHREKLTRGRQVPADACPLSEAFTGRYRQGVPKLEIAFIQHIAGRQMARHGYTLDALHLTTAERLRYRLAGWPLNLARMGTWLAVEWVQHHLPGRFGRRPSAKMQLARGDLATNTANKVGAR